MEAFEDIYRQFHGNVLAYIQSKVRHPKDAEDICSAVFEKILKNLDTYDAGRASLATWIYKIARNTITDYFRNHHIDEALEDDLSSTEYADDALLRRETLSALADALTRLSRQERDVVILHYYSGYTLKEISERTGIPYRTVKLRKQTALERLRFLMRDFS